MTLGSLIRTYLDNAENVPRIELTIPVCETIYTVLQQLSTPRKAARHFRGFCAVGDPDYEVE